MKQGYDQTNKQKSTKLLLVGAIVLFVFGFLAGIFWIQMKHPIVKETEFRNLSAAYNKVMGNYLNGAEPRQLINGAASGMLASLEDPYSQYLSGEVGAQYSESLSGQFYGIGAEMREEDGKFIINAVLKDTPAERGGLMAGDVIVAVDGEEISGKSLQQLITVIKGKEGSSVTVRFQRAGVAEPIEIVLKREAIKVETVTFERLADNIAHITINRFAGRTHEEFKDVLSALKQQGPIAGIVLDLRSNPGGALDETIAIASEFIPEGKKVLDVVYKNERRVDSYEAYKQEKLDVPVVVLVNGQSASASEVLAAALKESAGMTIVGEKTFGKGIVQSVSNFPDQSVLSLTEAQWKTPTGVWINKEGVKPDIEVKMPEYAYLRPLAIGAKIEVGSYGEDVKTLQQMLQALGYLANKQSLGIFDEQTKEALKQLQQAEGIPVNGNFDDKTGFLIVEKLRDKLTKEDTQMKKALELLQQEISH
ncbi:S41 family peptidase [Paenibacillus yanchengensis]|uniref:S41 family peptidase n=1 Tax=Paenibacillus yanchengensis TaxID=2035833 RepID=A0ABW4YFG3_9BACL